MDGHESKLSKPLIKIFILALVFWSLYLFEQSKDISVVPDPYWVNFAYTKGGLGEGLVEDGGIVPLLIDNAFYGVLEGSGGDINDTLASILPAQRPKEYGLVTYKPKDCSVENQCVSFVEQMMGREFNANAKDIPVNENQPCEGCGIVFWGGRYGHIAYILEVESPSMLLVEQNRLGCGLVSTRSVSFEELNNVKGFVK